MFSVIRDAKQMVLVEEMEVEEKDDCLSAKEDGE